MQHFGDWVLGDTGTDLSYTCRDEEQAIFPLTGATVTLVGTSPTSGRTRNLSSTVAAPATGVALFSDLTNGISFGAGETSDRFECRIKIVLGGETYYSNDFTFGVVAAP